MLTAFLWDVILKHQKIDFLLCTAQGVLHNHGGDSFFQKDKSCISPKPLLKSLLQFYKDLLEIKSCLLGAILELKLTYVFEKMELEVYSNGCYKMLTLRTLSVGQLYSFAF